MANSASAKGNPASHRMSNAKLKAKRARSYETGVKRKDENRKANEAAAARNRQFRADSERTPYEIAKLRRWVRRSELHSAYLEGGADAVTRFKAKQVQDGS